MAVYSIDNVPIELAAGDVINCDYSGVAKSCTLPKGTYKLECWGAEGTVGGSGGTTGKGGYSVGTVTIQKKINIYIYAGGKGTSGTTAATGGFNGGGRGYSTQNRTMGSGGGGSDIRIGQDSLYARVIVAGGAGGGNDSNASYYGGHAGGTQALCGTNLTATVSSGDRNGGGGSQTAGGNARTTTSWDASYMSGILKGSFGVGGGAVTTAMQYINGAGGGWYGGGAGGPDGGAGGGSGYVYTSSTASNYPSGCLLNSAYYLTDAQTIAGNTSFLSPSGTSETGHSGNGYVRITVIKVSGGGTFSAKLIGSWKSSSSVYAKTNDTWKKVKNMYVKKESTLPAVTPHIYGAIWDGSNDPSWTRTDDSADFADPIPAVNNGDGSSPFDECYPWSEIRRVEDSKAGTLVEIPKFWYKWTRDGASMKLQISTTPLLGFYTSPAHADRGDGYGERNFVYVGAYHCADNYKSETGVMPKVSLSRDGFRTNIDRLGENIWQWDYAMYWTICMLYLVEFADWNSQDKIGYGCRDDSGIESAGFCDAMTYHTGTNKSNRTTYGHTRYRWIEDIWGNVRDWCDGIYFSSANIYCINNPANFSDSSGGTKVGTRSTTSGYISSWTTPTAEGFEYALYPSAVAGGENTYVSDYCDYDSSGSSGVVLFVGGGYYQNQSCGLFYLCGGYAASDSYGSVGSRLMKLPNNWKKTI